MLKTELRLLRVLLYKGDLLIKNTYKDKVNLWDSDILLKSNTKDMSGISVKIVNRIFLKWSIYLRLLWYMAFISESNYISRSSAQTSIENCSEESDLLPNIFIGTRNLISRLYAQHDFIVVLMVYSSPNWKTRNELLRTNGRRMSAEKAYSVGINSRIYKTRFRNYIVWECSPQSARIGFCQTLTGNQ